MARRRTRSIRIRANPARLTPRQRTMLILAACALVAGIAGYIAATPVQKTIHVAMHGGEKLDAVERFGLGSNAYVEHEPERQLEPVRRPPSYAYSERGGYRNGTRILSPHEPARRKDRQRDAYYDQSASWSYDAPYRPRAQAANSDASADRWRVTDRYDAAERRARDTATGQPEKTVSEYRAVAGSAARALVQQEVQQRRETIAAPATPSGE
ncbi:MAG: hypothetical protein R3E02_04770 [Blastomonas sp.]